MDGAFAATHSGSHLLHKGKCSPFRGGVMQNEVLACRLWLSSLKEFTSSGSANTETTKVTGSLETKYRWTEYGLTFTEKWNTDNTLGTEIAVEDQVLGTFEKTQFYQVTSAGLSCD